MSRQSSHADAPRESAAPVELDAPSLVTGPPAPPGEGPAAFDERGRTVAWMARTLHRLYNAQAQRILDRESLSIAHWFYLRVLAERGELNQLELSRRVGIASQTAVPALDHMERRGILQRTRDPRDRRKYTVSLTDEGRALIERVMPDITALLHTSLRGIDATDMAVFWKVVGRISDNLTQAPDGEPVLD